MGWGLGRFGLNYPCKVEAVFLVTRAEVGTEGGRMESGLRAATLASS